MVLKAKKVSHLGNNPDQQDSNQDQQHQILISNNVVNIRVYKKMPPQCFVAMWGLNILRLLGRCGNSSQQS